MLGVPLRDRLVAAANPSGGWPYYRARSSRIEPTSWALLALSGPVRPGAAPAAPAVGSAHLEFLKSIQNGSGLLVDPGSPVANFGWNGLALLALDGAGFGDEPFIDRLTAALVSSKGVPLENDPGLAEQDNQLQAWSWIAGTFSWVEPTALAVLALKRRRERRPEAALTRIGEAERMLLDRVCPTGGWNYGNSSVLGQDLRAYVPTTALSLLALQDRAGEPRVEMSLDWLSRHATSERSSMALSLAAICLSVFRLPVAGVLGTLASQEAETDFLGNAHLMAMAHYALTIEAHDAAAFRVPRGAGRAA